MTEIINFDTFYLEMECLVSNHCVNFVTFAIWLLLKCLAVTVWNLPDFPITQILREIKNLRV